MIDQPSLPIFEGIRWGMPRVTNTCPLDSWLDLICIPHHTNLLLNPCPKLQDITSILSRPFEFLLNNDRDAALMLQIETLVPGAAGTGDGASAGAGSGRTGCVTLTTDGIPATSVMPPAGNTSPTLQSPMFRLCRTASRGAVATAVTDHDTAGEGSPPL